MTDNKYFSRSDNQYTFAKQRASIQNEISAWAYLDKKPDMPEFPPNSKLELHMIKSAEEFIKLRHSEIPEEYHRAAHDEAVINVWEEVLEKYPDMAFWVAQNKTVPIEVLEELAKHQDSKVRDMVARKRKIPESLTFVLANDKDASVRHALANNGKVTESVLCILVNDPWETVRERATEKLKALTKQSI